MQEKQLAKENVEYIISEDGTKIYYHNFFSINKSRGFVIIIQGTGGGKSNDYYSFAKKLNKKGFSVIRIDERGTGDSEGKRGDVKNYNIVIKDYINLIKKVKKQSKKVYVMGHSFGGVVVTKLAFELKNQVSGLILLNPMFGYAKEYGPSIRDIIFFIYCMLFQPFKPVYNITGDLNRINYQQDKEDAMTRNNDSRVVNKFSIRYLIKTKKIINQSEHFSKYNKLPLLLIRGERDEFVDKEKTKKIFSIWPHENKKEIVVKNAGHGAYIANAIVDDVLEWLNSI